MTGCRPAPHVAAIAGLRERRREPTFGTGTGRYGDVHDFAGRSFSTASNVAEFQPNLWAPWRMEYISGLAEPAKGGCFLCEYRDQPAADAEHFVLWRRAASFVVLNRFPYTNGHTLIAPLAHGAGLSDHPASVLAELAIQVRDAQRVLAAILNPDGFNIGMNLGRCAGAGLPDHIHYHIVPRWNGDTNFMTVVGNARVIPQSLEQVRERAIAEARRIGIIG